MEYIREQLRKIFEEIRFKESNVEKSGEIGIGTYKISTIISTRKMDYAHHKFSVEINFGTYEKLKSLYTIEFQQKLNDKFALIEDTISEMAKGYVIKDMEITVYRGTRWLVENCLI